MQAFAFIYFNENSLSRGSLAGEPGFEPRYHPPEGCVLPLDDSPILLLSDPESAVLALDEPHYTTPAGGIVA